MAGDPEVRANTKAINDLNRALKRLVTVFAALNTTLVEIGRMMKEERDEIDGQLGG